VTVAQRDRDIVRVPAQLQPSYSIPALLSAGFLGYKAAGRVHDGGYRFSSSNVNERLLFEENPVSWHFFIGVPDGIRTRVIAVKGRCPRPG
jgi:hypothetical protein